MAQARVELGARNTRVPELEARTIDLGIQLEQSASQVRIDESKYSILYDESQTLKKRLAMGVFVDAEMEQRLINASKDVSCWGTCIYFSLRS